MLKIWLQMYVDPYSPFSHNETQCTHVYERIRVELQSKEENIYLPSLVYLQLAWEPSFAWKILLKGTVKEKWYGV